MNASLVSRLWIVANIPIMTSTMCLGQFSITPVEDLHCLSVSELRRICSMDVLCKAGDPNNTLAAPTLPATGTVFQESTQLTYTSLIRPTVLRSWFHHAVVTGLTSSCHRPTGTNNFEIPIERGSFHEAKSQPTQRASLSAAPPQEPSAA